MRLSFPVLAVFTISHAFAATVLSDALSCASAGIATAGPVSITARVFHCPYWPRARHCVNSGIDWYGTNVCDELLGAKHTKYNYCKARYLRYDTYVKYTCGNLDGVRVWRLVAMSLVICISAYATRSLYSSGRSTGKSDMLESEPGKALAAAAAIAQCRRETGLEGEVVHHYPNGQQPQNLWDRILMATSDPYQQRFYEWALERQPLEVAIGPRLDLQGDVSYPSLTHELSGKSLKRMSFVYVGNPLDSSKCWVFAEGEVGTLAGHNGYFLTNVGMVIFTRLQYRSNGIRLSEGSWVVVNNQAIEEDVSEASVALMGWANTLLSLVGFVAGGSSAWSASLGINAATGIVVGLAYTAARGNGPCHERVRGCVGPMLSSLRGPALLGSWAWAIMSLETLGAILSLFSLALEGSDVAALMALVVRTIGSIGTLPSMSGRVALIGSILSWYSIEFVVEVFGLIRSDENIVVRIEFASGAIESCILLPSYSYAALTWYRTHMA